MVRSALGKAQIGFLLISFTLGFGLVTPIMQLIVLLLMVTATWQLRNENKAFRYALTLGYINLALASVGLVLALRPVAPFLTIGLILGIVANIVTLLRLYWLFAGCKQLATAQMSLAALPAA